MLIVGWAEVRSTVPTKPAWARRHSPSKTGVNALSAPLPTLQALAITIASTMRILVIDQAPRTPKSQPPYDVKAIEKLLNSYASAGTTVEIGFPDDFEGSNVFLTIGAQSALNGLHHMMETPAIVRKIFWAAQNGYDAVISSNTFEPGVDGGRLAVDIPVIGLMRTARHAALTLADRVGITVPLAGHVPYTWRILRAYGLDSFVSDIRPLGVYGKDIAQRKQEIFDITTKLIRSLIDDTRAEIILPL